MSISLLLFFLIFIVAPSVYYKGRLNKQNKFKLLGIFIFGAALGLAFSILLNLKENDVPLTPTSPSKNHEPTKSAGSEISPCGYTTPVGQGPYYVSGAPLLEDGNLNYSNSDGRSLLLSGYVLEGIENPKPIPNAEIDIWQTDAEGNYHPLGSGSVDDYDPEEVELRGVVTTDGVGYYEVTTILPEEYSGRPRHMHIKVRAPGKPELTTQLYWQQESDENKVSSSDINPGSRDCQVLKAEPYGEILRSSYNFYLK